MGTLVGQYGAEAQLSSTGGLLTNTSVTVLTMGGATASLFTDITGNTAAANPVFTDSKGNLLFFAAPGQYQLQIGGAIVSQVIIDEPAVSVGVIGGPAGPLNSSGQIPSSQIPSLSGSTNDIYNVKLAPYNAAGNGTNDDTTAISAAITAAVNAGGGSVYLPPGTYKTTATLTAITVPTVSIRGQDSAATVIQPTNNGDCIRVQMASFVAEASAGAVAGLTIDGTNAGASGCGLHIGDAMNGLLEDVRVRNFTGASAVGIWMDNRTNYTERWAWRRVNAVNNTTSVRFDVNGSSSVSFGYHVIDRLHVVVNSGQVGVRLQNGALVYNGQIGISGNIASGGTFMQIAGITGSGGTGLANCAFHIQAELTGGGSGNGIQLSQFAQMTGAGTVDLSSGTLTSTVGSPNPGLFNLSGWVKIPGVVGVVRLDGTVATTATAGTNGAAPAQVAAYQNIYVNGINYKIPLYNP